MGKAIGMGMCLSVLLLWARWLEAGRVGVPGAVRVPASVLASAGEPEHLLHQDISTFVLTPIANTVLAMEVPAKLYGPVTNNSCSDWQNKCESCYLPGRVLRRVETSEVPGLSTLLERHASAFVGAWRPGAWPASGASLLFDLRQYVSVEHLWLATRIRFGEAAGGCYLTLHDDPRQTLKQAVLHPLAELEIEVFDGVRDAVGYPRYVKY